MISPVFNRWLRKQAIGLSGTESDYWLHFYNMYDLITKYAILNKF